MKEAEIRKKAIKILTDRNWICWFPSKVRYKQNDIFGIIDLLAIKRKKMKKIQLTTLPNLSIKRKKITNFLKKNKVQMTVEVWAWSKKKKQFKKEKINIKIKKKLKRSIRG
ncbi:hypothetical protein COU02_01020 [bacterium (Candidatus Gribaldobacteria) CG10_big_fil_rev_8_21_14_0_10_37_46]|uniref:Uncharacterized protein n=1 Tax=bacterium (Candidatus Gribaldobacteria) CG10_big_fil_rev_8_21_14_0_10_37_46 TaxID=2014276 RepID=A0A2H0UWE3_9BACT|nr:MAG: hypothetical protein COU02_01020 [bacterium (Candidatus Gribaldobacteria) CG10_big_fil_rev_8_21_14_0_10_37_46]